MSRRFVHRQDSTKAALVAHALSLGAAYYAIDGALDGLLLFRGRLILVDWKVPRGTLTPTQKRLVLEGWPVQFISTTSELEAVLFPGRRPVDRR